MSWCVVKLFQFLPLQLRPRLRNQGRSLRNIRPMDTVGQWLLIVEVRGLRPTSRAATPVGHDSTSMVCMICVRVFC